MSFVTGIFPSILKTSKVIPVFKKGLPLEASNYRSTSLLSNIEKIYAKLMYSRLVSFLKAHNQIYSRQFGFRKSHSTVHTLLSKLNHYCIFGAANNWVSHGVHKAQFWVLCCFCCINDLHFAIKSSEVCHFADDTHLLNFAKSLVSLILSLGDLMLTSKFWQPA